MWGRSFHVKGCIGCPGPFVYAYMSWCIWELISAHCKFLLDPLQLPNFSLHRKESQCEARAPIIPAWNTPLHFLTQSSAQLVLPLTTHIYSKLFRILAISITKISFFSSWQHQNVATMQKQESCFLKHSNQKLFLSEKSIYNKPSGLLHLLAH